MFDTSIKQKYFHLICLFYYRMQIMKNEILTLPNKKNYHGFVVIDISSSRGHFMKFNRSKIR